MPIDVWEQDDARAAARELSPGRVLAQSLSIWSRMLQIPVRFLQIPFEAINWGLNRIAETANDSLLSPAPAPAAPPEAEPAVSGVPLPAGSPAPRIEEIIDDNIENDENDPDALRGDRLKLVRWRICFVRHGEEYSFPPHEELIADDLGPGVFEAWKSAEFVQSLTDPEKAPEVPETWSAYLPANCRHGNGRLRRFPPGDMKHLRVFFEVIRYSRRERMHFHERQLTLLREIATNLR